ncbi:MAG: hypothetical protein R2856_19950 [Caldilineaceae bacterium]
MTINSLSTPRQDDFLRRVLPTLKQTPWLLAIWLSGSSARDADRWSNVNLHVLIDVDPSFAVGAALVERLDLALAEGWRCALREDALIRGFTLIPDPMDVQRRRPLRSALGRTGAVDGAPGPSPPGAAAGDESVAAAEIARRVGRAAPCAHAAERRHGGGESVEFLDRALASARAGEPARTSGAGGAWTTPARSSSISWWRSTARIAHPRHHVNQYLGPLQRDAFEKTLPVRAATAESWIGQAVALIVLYRWYAPQLVEIHPIDYPTALEKSVLALLSAEVDGWPAMVRSA